MPNYALDAADVPVPQVPTNVLDVGLMAPNVWEGFTEGTLGPELVEILQRDAVRSELMGRHGGGMIGVLWGLDLTATGLVLEISKGQARIDGPIPESLATVFPDDEPYDDLALADDADNYIWMSRAGVFSKMIDSTAAPGAGPWCYLGMVPVASGVASTPDYSGRVQVEQRGQARVRTGDTGAPAWSPPETVSFWHQTATGLWFWDGYAYHFNQPLVPMHPTTFPAGYTQVIPEGFRSVLHGKIKVEGRLVVDGELRMRD